MKTHSFNLIIISDDTVDQTHIMICDHDTIDGFEITRITKEDITTNPFRLNTATIIPIHTPDKKQVCHSCYSDDVLLMRWVNPNTMEVDSMQAGTEGLIHWCNCCKQETHIIENPFFDDWKISDKYSTAYRIGNLENKKSLLFSPILHTEEICEPDGIPVDIDSFTEHGFSIFKKEMIELFGPDVINISPLNEY